MPTAEIITIGTELLLGQQVDTNAALIAQALAEAGIDVFRQTSVGDNAGRIAAAVHEALDRADIVICAGGLGPTVDDVTREAVAQAIGRDLMLHEPSLRQIKERFVRLGRPMTDNNRRQAMIPAGAVVVDNPLGSAPGFIVDGGRGAVAAMPGVPAELAAMLRDQVMPWLARRFKTGATIITRVLKTIGVPESEIDQRIADLFQAGINPTIAVLAHAGQVDVKITAKAGSRVAAEALIAPLEMLLRERLGDCIYAGAGEAIEKTLGDALRARGWSIAVAESSTGGLVAEMITAVAGSSDYFRGGIVAYSDEAKVRHLNVPRRLIERHGSVSEEVAVAMAAGAKAAFGATLALSITGIAGPTGGSAQKPVGLVYIALAGSNDSPIVERRQFPGDRELVRRRAALAALALAWKNAR